MKRLLLITIAFFTISSFAMGPVQVTQARAQFVAALRSQNWQAAEAILQQLERGNQAQLAVNWRLELQQAQRAQGREAQQAAQFAAQQAAAKAQAAQQAQAQAQAQAAYAQQQQAIAQQMAQQQQQANLDEQKRMAEQKRIQDLALQDTQRALTEARNRLAEYDQGLQQRAQEIINLRGEVSKCTAANKACTDQLAAEQNTRKTLEDRIRNDARTIEELQKKCGGISAAAQQDLDKLRAELNKAREDAANQRRENEKNTQELRARFEKDINQAQAKLNEEVEKARKAEQKRQEEFQKQLEASRKETEAARQARDKIRADLEAVRKECAAAQGALKVTQKQVEPVQAQAQELEGRVQKLQKDLEQSRKEAEGYLKSADIYEQGIKTRDAQIEKLREELRDCRDEIELAGIAASGSERLEKELQEAVAANQRLTQQILKGRNDLEKCLEEVKRLEEQLEDAADKAQAAVKFQTLKLRQALEEMTNRNTTLTSRLANLDERVTRLIKFIEAVQDIAQLKKTGSSYLAEMQKIIRQ